MKRPAALVFVFAVICCACAGSNPEARDVQTEWPEPAPQLQAVPQGPTLAEIEAERQKQAAEAERQRLAEQQKQEALRAEQDRLNKGMAEDRVRQARAKTTLDGLPPLQRHVLLQASRKLDSPPRGVLLNDQELALVSRYYGVVVYGEKADNALLQMAEQVGVVEFFTNLKWRFASAEERRALAVEYYLLPPMPGTRGKGHEVALEFSRLYKTKGRDAFGALAPIQSKWVQDHSRLFKPVLP
jgi:hypothetical protein